MSVIKDFQNKLTKIFDMVSLGPVFLYLEIGRDRKKNYFENLSKVLYCKTAE